jgi:hypothetical protein
MKTVTKPGARYLDAIRVAVIEAMAEQDVTVGALSTAMDLNSGTVWQRINDPAKAGDWTMHEIAELHRILEFTWPDVD